MNFSLKPHFHTRFRNLAVDYFPDEDTSYFMLPDEVEVQSVNRAACDKLRRTSRLDEAWSNPEIQDFQVITDRPRSSGDPRISFILTAPRPGYFINYHIVFGYLQTLRQTPRRSPLCLSL